MISTLCYLYRPTLVADGEGGYTRTLGDPTRVYAQIQWDDDKVAASVPRKTDVDGEDILQVGDSDTSRYRVIGTSLDPQTNRTGLTLEKIAWPPRA